MPDKAMFARGKSGYGLLACNEQGCIALYRVQNAERHMHHTLRYSTFLTDICIREGKTCVHLEATCLLKHRYPHDIHRRGLAHG